MSQIYPAADAIVGQQIASEREVCHILGLGRTAFQRWKRFEFSDRENDDRVLMPLVAKIFKSHRRRYGSRRIVEDLKAIGVHCSRRRVSKLLKIAELRPIQPKSFRPRSTESKHSLGYNPNLLLDLAEPTERNELWVGDITYIPIHGIGFSYLSMLMDRYSRMIIGWSLRDDMAEPLVVDALREAIKLKQPPSGLIHHSDRGGQYAGKRYRSILNRAKMRQSMSRAGDCYDNAFMESCFGTIKTEMEMTEYESVATARRELREYIDYFNNDRRHSSIGYLTPSQFEAAT